MVDTAITAIPPFRQQFDNARDPYAARNALGIAGTGAGLITSVTSPLSVTSGVLSINTTTLAEASPQCGRLAYVSTTALSFVPFNGDRIKINGTLFAIPSAGITGLANTSVFVNGTGGQNLAASTVYYVYAFSNSGTITADFSTTTHATSSTAGNVGTEIKSGVDTRTLIGLIRTNASSQFQSDSISRWVLSWFNRRDISLIGASTAGAATTSNTNVELTTSARVNFVTWADEAVSAALYGTMQNNVAANYSTIYIGVDGSTTVLFPQASLGASHAVNAFVPATGAGSAFLSEGFHFLTPVGNVPGVSTSTYFTGISAIIRG